MAKIMTPVSRNFAADALVSVGLNDLPSVTTSAILGIPKLAGLIPLDSTNPCRRASSNAPEVLVPDP